MSVYADLAKRFRLGDPLGADELQTLHTLAAAHGNHQLERLTAPAVVCDCGHTSKEHAPTAKVRVTPRPCLVAGCECQQFRQAPVEPVAGDAA